MNRPSARPPTTSESSTSGKATATTKLTRIAGVGGAVVGVFSAFVKLPNLGLQIAGVATCVCVTVLLLVAAHDRDHGKLSTGMIVCLSAAGASVLVLVLLLAGQPGGGQVGVLGAPSTSSAAEGPQATSARSPSGSSELPSSSAPASTVTWLADLQPIASDGPDTQAWTVKAVQVNKKIYNRSLVVDGEWCNQTKRDYVLGGEYRRFRTMVGMTDDSPEPTPLRFHIFADGKTVKSIREAGTAGPQEVDVSVEGVNRLTLAIFPLEDEDLSCPGPERIGVWIDPTLSR